MEAIKNLERSNTRTFILMCMVLVLSTLVYIAGQHTGAFIYLAMNYALMIRTKISNDTTFTDMCTEHKKLLTHMQQLTGADK